MTRLLSISLLVAVASAGYADDASADEPCPDYTRLDEARAAERACHQLPVGSDRVACLDCLVEWWFHNGGNFVDYNPQREMTRIMRDQLWLDPTSSQTLSLLVFYLYSIELEELAGARRESFGSEILDLLQSAEKWHGDDYRYYTEMLHVPLLVVMNRNIDPLTKRRYYALLKHLVTTAERLAPSAAQDDTELQEMRMRREFARRVVDRNAALALP